MRLSLRGVLGREPIAALKETKLVFYTTIVSL